MPRPKRYAVTLSTGFFFTLIAVFLMSEWTPLPIFNIIPMPHIITRTIRTSLHTITRFGRTHFIVGYEDSIPPSGHYEQSRDIKKATEIEVCDGVYFSPNDQLRNLLIDYINQEKESIKVAVYMFTDGAIADALIHAYRRGVEVSVLIDPGCLRDTYNKIGKLLEQGIPIYVYDAQNHTGGLGSLMHHKFALFSRNKDDQKFVWTGSFNFTRSANERNHENAILLHDDKAYIRFDQQFNEMINNEAHQYGVSKTEKSKPKK